jgi:hypothetical protein
MSLPPSDSRFVHVKRFGCGKLSVFARIDPRFVDTARVALGRSLRVEVRIDFEALALSLRTVGVPEDAVHELLATARVDDAVFLGEKFPT